ncbi:MAG: CDP-alcohol phosphatidyltransferase family protein [Anaeromyxobacter sp.]
MASGAWAVLAHLGLVALTAVVYAAVRPPYPARLDGYRGPLRWLGGWAYWATRPILRAAVRGGWTPSALTWIGLALNVAAGVAAARGAWGWAWVALLWGSTGDLLDGALARETGTGSKAGAFLDSNLDRLSEIALLGGFAVGLPAPAGEAWAVAALAASLMVSYTRARGEGLGVDCPGFGMERPHRMVLFLFALVVAPFLAPSAADLLLVITCGVVAVGASLTAVARLVVIDRLLRAPPPVAAEEAHGRRGTQPGGMP